MSVALLTRYGNSFKVIFDDGSATLAIQSSTTLWYIKNNSQGAKTIIELGNQTLINFSDGSIQVAVPTGGDIFITGVQSSNAPPPSPATNLIDTISPGHHITNPGGTIASGWAWHIANEGGRGGDDWNYSFGTPFKAPGAGTVNHRDITGVGMVVELVLDTPVARINPEQAAGYDQFGPIVSVHFEHCSASIDGHHNQGDVIGKSGNGYGLYPSHLHVHGQTTDAGGFSSSSNRCCLWGFI